MKRNPLYSRSHRAATGTQPAQGQPEALAEPGRLERTWRDFNARHEKPVLIGAGFLAALAAFGLSGLMAEGGPRLSQRDIDKAVLHTLENMPAKPSVAAAAYEVIRPSVVLVRQREEDFMDMRTAGIGTGVVIVDSGIILTNLHVVGNGLNLKVTFADGTDADADLVSAVPEHDLAVIKARKIPDDLIPATLRSTAGLQSGDEVVAVGFPFGIGPSVSAGVVSGLRREFSSPEGKRTLTNLIQFDAVANPGNSGGPLVTREGEVVGIVTGILNPTEQRVNIGIAFAVPIENAAAAVGMSPF